LAPHINTEEEMYKQNGFSSIGMISEVDAAKMKKIRSFKILGDLCSICFMALGKAKK